MKYSLFILFILTMNLMISCREQTSEVKIVPSTHEVVIAIQENNDLVNKLGVDSILTKISYNVYANEKDLFYYIASIYCGDPEADPNLIPEKLKPLIKLRQIHKLSYIAKKYGLKDHELNSIIIVFSHRLKKMIKKNLKIAMIY